MYNWVVDQFLEIVETAETAETATTAKTVKIAKTRWKNATKENPKKWKKRRIIWWGLKCSFKRNIHFVKDLL